MKKKLIIINGTMGVGKTVVCKKLYKKLDKAIWLDGDWCWMMNPFEANETNIAMVHSNIDCLLKSFLSNPNFDYVIFDWVIHKQEILDKIVDPLKEVEFDSVTISLTCSPEELRKRMGNDPDREGSIEASVERLKLYDDLDSQKVDTSGKTPDQVVEEIVALLK